MPRQTTECTSLIADLGVTATVVMDEHTGGPRTVGDDIKQDWRDFGPGHLADIRVVSIWTFAVALFALQNPTPENIDRALELIGTSGDVDDVLDEATFRAQSIPVPSGFGYEGWPGDV